MPKILLIGAGAVVIAIIVASVYSLKVTEMSAVVGLPMLSIGAVIILLILLCSMAVVFASFDLQDKTQALALPEGSIRAVIALMLIVLFAILCIYLYGSLATGQTSSLGLLDEGTRTTLVNTYGAPNVVAIAKSDGKFDVWLRQPASPDGVDFAKQLLVLVGTLVTSISSFYFGSRTAGQSTQAPPATTPAPVISTITPDIYKRDSGPQDFKLQGSGLDRITGLKLIRSGKEIAVTEVTATADQVLFKLDIASASQEAGVWSITLIDSTLGEQATPQVLAVS
jgi:hypothetical protein